MDQLLGHGDFSGWQHQCSHHNKDLQLAFVLESFGEELPCQAVAELDGWGQGIRVQSYTTEFPERHLHPRSNFN
eukprot:5850491-Amphidinium_carterae.1